jgi:tRNA threonylcarbamoyladenosine biosynthesis protein TsaE
MHADDLTVSLPNEAATLGLGAAIGLHLALAVTPGMTIWLEGDLGAGKTTLVRGLLRAVGETGAVKSPTYSLVEVHVVSGIYLYHFDFYRFNQPEEYLDAGLDEYFSRNGICLVEWPDKACPYVPDPDLCIRLDMDGDGRKAQLAAHTPKGRTCLAAATPSSSPPPA